MAYRYIALHTLTVELPLITNIRICAIVESTALVLIYVYVPSLPLPPLFLSPLSLPPSLSPSLPLPPLPVLSS